MECGIYKITCLRSGKIYVGSSRDIKTRIRRHFAELSRKTHKNKHLQSAFNLYGESAFQWKVLEHVIKTESLQEREQFWIDETQCFRREIGYNIAISAENRTLSQETKAKMSERAKKRPSNYYAYAKALYTGRPISEAQKKQISKTLAGRQRTKETWEKWHEAMGKFKYTLTGPNGEIHETMNPAQFARENALNVCHIYGMRDGKRKSTKGWKLISCIKK